MHPFDVTLWPVKVEIIQQFLVNIYKYNKLSLTTYWGMEGGTKEASSHIEASIKGNFKKSIF